MNTLVDHQRVTGQPDAVLRGYSFTPKAGFPAGVYEGPPAAVWSVVVLSELPRVRDTLLLRLLGRGAAMRQAIADLAALPDGAWEREVALEPLVALKMKMPEDSDDDNELRQLLGAMNELYEQWKERTLRTGRNEGHAEGRGEALHEALIACYEARFGKMPASLRKLVDATSDATVLRDWVPVFAARSEAEIAEALAVSTAPGARRIRATSRRTPRRR